MTYKKFFLLFSINSINAKDIANLEETLEKTKESILTTLETEKDIILTETDKKTKIFITAIGGLISILTAIVLYNKFFKEKKTNKETTEDLSKKNTTQIPISQYEIIKSIVSKPIDETIYNDIKQKNSEAINFQYLKGSVFSFNHCNFLGNGNYINLEGDELKEENIIGRVLDSLKNLAKDQITSPIILYFDEKIIEALFKNTDFQNYNNQLKIYVKIWERLDDLTKNTNDVATIVNNLVDKFNDSKKNWPYDKIAYYISIPGNILDTSLVKEVLYYFNEYMKKYMTNSLLLFSPAFTS